MGESRKKKGRGLLFYAVPVFLILVILVSGTLFFRDYFQYREAESEYDGLAQYTAETVNISTETAAADAEPAAPVLEEIAEEDVDVGAETKERPTAPTPPPVEQPQRFIHVDYTGLRAVNPDFVGYLYVPGAGISYPVAKGPDNDYYLHRTFEGRNNFAGCIFLDAGASGTFGESNTFIYGHNMKNGSMFGRLRNLSSRYNVICYPYVYLYTEEGIRCYRIFSAYSTTAGSSMYKTFTGNSNYDSYVKQAKAQSLLRLPNMPDLSSRPPILSLSTCQGRGGANRFIVHAALVEIRPNS